MEPARARQAGRGRERRGGAQRDGAMAQGVALRCSPAEIVQFTPVWWRASPPSRGFLARRMAPRGSEQQRALRTGRPPLVNYPCSAGTPRAGPLMNVYSVTWSCLKRWQAVRHWRFAESSVLGQLCCVGRKANCLFTGSARGSCFT
jgi:hypothetical protein